MVVGVMLVLVLVLVVVAVVLRAMMLSLVSRRERKNGWRS